MGIVRRLVTLPLAPVEGVIWLAEQLQKQAEASVYGDSAIGELQRLTEAYRQGEISEQEYAVREQVLLQRIETFERPDLERFDHGF